MNTESLLKHLTPRRDTLHRLGRILGMIFVSGGAALLLVPGVHLVTPLTGVLGTAVTLAACSFPFAFIAATKADRVRSLPALAVIIALGVAGIELTVAEPGDAAAGAAVFIVTAALCFLGSRIVDRFTGRGRTNRPGARRIDMYELLVRRAVVDIRSENPDQIQASIGALQTLEVGELLAELCVWVEDVTAGKDVDRLLAAATLPLPERPVELIAAVNLQGPDGLRALHATAGGDLVKLIASLLALIASLQEAGERV